jgi:hypothetical protein
MSVRLCRICGHKGVDVDAAARCHFCRADETSPTSSRHMHALLAALGKKAPGIDAETKAEAAKTSRARMYEATPEQLGCTTPREVWDGIIGGTLKLDPSTAEGFDRIMRALSVMRGASFKHPKCTYGVADCTHVRAALGVHDVPTLARAIVAASKNKWFASRKTITFVELKDKAPELLAESSTLTTATDARRTAADACIVDINELKRVSPVDGAELDINLGMLGLDAIRAHHDIVKQRIAQWT